MAEEVQLHLEARLPELNDFIEQKLFTRPEVDDIVKQRTRYEYRLKRRAGAILEDFLAYIEYEKQLEQRRRDRLARLQQSEKGEKQERKKLKKNNALSDHSIVEHIIGLYWRALVKFGGNLGLWTDFIEYCWREGARQTVSKGIARAIQLHPRSAELWILAARWEWQGSGNAAAARKIFQRAVRLTHSEQLWLAYFELEVQFAATLRERQAILLGDEESSDNEIINGALAILVLRHYLEKTSSLALEAFIRIAALSDNEDFKTRIFDLLCDHLTKNDAQKLPALAHAFIQSSPLMESLQKALSLLDSLFGQTTEKGALLESCCNVLQSIPTLFADIESQAIVRSAVEQKIDQLQQLALEDIPQDITAVLREEIHCSESLYEVYSEKISTMETSSLKQELIDLVVDRIPGLKWTEEQHKLILAILGTAALNTKTCALLKIIEKNEGKEALTRDVKALSEKRALPAQFYLAQLGISNDEETVTLFEKALILEPRNQDIWQAYIRWAKQEKKDFILSSKLVARLRKVTV